MAWPLGPGILCWTAGLGPSLAQKKSSPPHPAHGIANSQRRPKGSFPDSDPRWENLPWHRDGGPANGENWLDLWLQWRKVQSSAWPCRGNATRDSEDRQPGLRVDIFDGLVPEMFEQEPPLREHGSQCNSRPGKGDHPWSHPLGQDGESGHVAGKGRRRYGLLFAVLLCLETPGACAFGALAIGGRQSIVPSKQAAGDCPLHRARALSPGHPAWKRLAVAGDRQHI